jgi:hypothetical protein
MVSITTSVIFDRMFTPHLPTAPQSANDEDAAQTLIIPNVGLGYRAGLDIELRAGGLSW